MKKQFDDIIQMLQSDLVTTEHPPTQSLMNDLQDVWSRGYFTRQEFLQMCFWKEPRGRRQKDWKSHTEERVQAVSRKALAVSDEELRCYYLCQLKGVGPAFSSAILTLINPTDYGVIDARVWQILYLYDEVNHTPRGQGLTVSHWLEFLPKLRTWASNLDVSVRTIERTIYQHHHDIQTEPLP